MLLKWFLTFCSIYCCHLSRTNYALTPSTPAYCCITFTCEVITWPTITSFLAWFSQLWLPACWNNTKYVIFIFRALSWPDSLCRVQPLRWWQVLDLTKMLDLSQSESDPVQCGLRTMVWSENDVLQGNCNQLWFAYYTGLYRYQASKITWDV